MMTWSSERLRLASVEITQRCNNACLYCEQPKSAQDMPAGLFVELVDQLAAEGVNSIALGGGEPTLHPALPALLKAARLRGLRAGLTTNARDPDLVRELAGDGLLDSFGVSAPKGDWLALVGHPLAVVNLLLLRGGLPALLGWAVLALRHGAHALLLLGYKGDRPALTPDMLELTDAFSLLSALGRQAGATVAADDYTRRRLGLADTCGDGFMSIAIDGTRDRCCFPACEFRAA
jgi:hypothetical protein